MDERKISLFDSLSISPIMTHKGIEDDVVPSGDEDPFIAPSDARELFTKLDLASDKQDVALAIL
jgi:hypothetical protein